MSSVYPLLFEINDLSQLNNALILPCDIHLVSDGSHTFQELYDHRNMLWILVLKHYKDHAFKTRRDEDGICEEGWFIAGLNTPFGQLTYHLPEVYWKSIDVPELSKNDGFDNHTSKDVLTRLAALVEE